MASNSQGNSNAPAISQTERDSINKSYQSFVELHKMHHARPLYVLQNQIQDSACVHTTALRPAGPVSLLDALLKGKTPQTLAQAHVSVQSSAIAHADHDNRKVIAVQNINPLLQSVADTQRLQPELAKKMEELTQSAMAQLAQQVRQRSSDPSRLNVAQAISSKQRDPVISSGINIQREIDLLALTRSAPLVSQSPFAIHDQLQATSEQYTINVDALRQRLSNKLGTTGLLPRATLATAPIASVAVASGPAPALQSNDLTLDDKVAPILALALQERFTQMLWQLIRLGRHRSEVRKVDLPTRAVCETKRTMTELEIRAQTRLKEITAAHPDEQLELCHRYSELHAFSLDEVLRARQAQVAAATNAPAEPRTTSPFRVPPSPGQSAVLDPPPLAASLKRPAANAAGGNKSKKARLAEPEPQVTEPSPIQVPVEEMATTMGLRPRHRQITMADLVFWLQTERRHNKSELMQQTLLRYDA